MPPDFEGVDRPYAASRGGFLKVSCATDRSLTCEYFSMDGAPLYRHVLAAKTGK